MGKSLIDEAAREAGAGWITLVIVLSSVLTGAAVLRAAARVFWGLGPREDPAIVDTPAPEEVDPELDYPHDRVPRTMTVPLLGLSVAGLGIGLVPGLRDAVGGAAARFVDGHGYAATVLRGRRPEDLADLAVSPGFSDVLLGLVTAGAAVGLAYLALAAPRPGLHRVGVSAGRAIAGLRQLHSGYVGDYVTWLVAGAAVLGGLFAVTLTG